MQDDVRAAIANSFLSEMDPKLVQRLVEQAIPLDLEAGAILYPEEGDPRMALVISGLLRVYLTSVEGRQITVRYAREGDVLGTAVAVAGPVRTPVKAVTDSRVLLLSVTAAQRLAQTDASVAWAFAEEVTRRLYDVLDELAGTAFASVKARVARHLLDLSNQDQETGRWTVTATQQQVPFGRSSPECSKSYAPSG
jgi:CRP/FNR family transcriptional regulator, cyclic AMP receptor protein